MYGWESMEWTLNGNHRVPFDPKFRNSGDVVNLSGLGCLKPALKCGCLGLWVAVLL